MIIRNKFNGYGFDGSRLCHDPVSLSIAATQAGAASSAAATAAAAQAATTAAGTAAAQAAAVEAAKAASLEAGKAASLEAGKTAALEASKKGIIDASMQQASQQAAQQGIAQAGTQATQQAGVEAAKQGIFSANPAGMPPTAGGPITPPAGPATPLPPAGGDPNTMSAGINQANTSVGPNTISDMPIQGEPLKILEAKPGMTLEEAQALNQQLATRPPVDPTKNPFAPFKSNVPSPDMKVPEFITPDVGMPGKPPIVGEGAPIQMQGAKAFPDQGTLARAGSKAAEQGIAQMNTTPTSELMLKPTYAEQFPLAPKSKIAEGFETGLQYVKDNPITTGLGLMTAGQYMNQPEEEDKDKYKNTVDMSEFQPSIPTQRPFTRSYEYQSYQAGGPVEDMSRMNSLGANTGFPMARLQTPAYAVSSATPMPVNTLTPTADASVNAYTGEQRFAEGGISAAERREYGLTTRGQRAARNLTKSYEEMEEERQKEAMKLMGERSDPGIVPRSRTQMLSSPFSAAMAEHARLGKKAKVPVVEMPKTNLGDIDNYMDIPIEAAKGGIMHGLGGYSDGGRLLKGPGDGVSDSIPAVIGKRQPARLADGEFVIPARIVSELGNGSTEAGARKLYAMMERVQATRKKSIGKKKVAVNSKADKHLPA